MVEVSSVVIRYAVQGARMVQRIDDRIREGFRRTAAMARAGVQRTKEWMLQNKAAMAALSTVILGLMWGLIRASPTLSAHMDIIKLGFSLIAMELGQVFAPAFLLAQELVFKLADAFIGLPGPVKILIGILLAAVAVFVGLLGVMAVASLVIGAVSLPVLLIVAAIAALIAIVALLVVAWKKDWGGIQTKTKAAWDFIVGLIERAIDWLKHSVLGPFMDSFRRLWEAHGAAITRAAKAAWGFITTIVDIAVATIKFIVGAWWIGFKAFWRTIWETLKFVVGTAFDGIRLLIETGVDFVITLLRIIGAFLSGDWGKAWDLAKGFVKRTWDRIGEFVSNGVDRVKSLLQGIADIAKDAGSWGWDLLKNFGQGLLDAVDDWVKPVVNKIIDGLNLIPGVSLDKMGGGGLGIAKKFLSDTKKTADQLAASFTVPHKWGNDRLEDVLRLLENPTGHPMFVKNVALRALMSGIDTIAAGTKIGKLPAGLLQKALDLDALGAAGARSELLKLFDMVDPARRQISKTIGSNSVQGLLNIVRSHDRGLLGPGAAMDAFMQNLNAAGVFQGLRHKTNQAPSVNVTFQNGAIQLEGQGDAFDFNMLIARITDALRDKLAEQGRSV